MLKPKEALDRIIEGNRRFAQGKSIHPNLGEELRNSLIYGQKPFAAVLACSDSRVPVEIILDMGLGDIFVVRNAGNTLSNSVTGSLEYAVKTLGVKLIMILGHNDCGAVKEALDIYNNYQAENLTHCLKEIFDCILPSITQSDKEALNDIIKLNTKNQAEKLVKESSYLAQKLKDNKIMIVSANYCLATRLIEVL
ncbi:MAG: carbonic anhydrase [Candidatus Gastranaerophilales bacterium]|nr:carbonic anhydrase [Candidatus Gastranaerophilales bacterium]